VIVEQAWAFRARVEREASLRFARLAGEILSFDPESPVPAMMRKAAEEEGRHLSLCEELAGGPVAGGADARIAPRSLGPREAAFLEVSFLGRWIPSMLAGAAGATFEPFDAALDSAELLRYGVLPISRKRSTFAQTLLEVVFPGLEQFGISTEPALAWLNTQRIKALVPIPINR